MSLDEQARNLDVVRALNAAENAHDLDGIGATQHETMFGSLNGIKQELSRSSDRETNEGLFAGLPDYTRQFEELFAAGDKVVAQWRFTGTHLGDFLGIPATGRTVEVAGCSVFTFREGKIAGADMYLDIGSIIASLNA